jgi:hypothetical protein
MNGVEAVHKHASELMAMVRHIQAQFRVGAKNVNLCSNGSSMNTHAFWTENGELRAGSGELWLPCA